MVEICFGIGVIPEINRAETDGVVDCSEALSVDVASRCEKKKVGLARLAIPAEALEQDAFGESDE